jgi:hypothetical protein
MAAFTVYLDASGTKRKPVLTVAGFVSRVDKWERFEKEWPAILNAEGINIFRMTDFVSSNGDFKGWKGPDHTARRKDFLNRLIDCVKRNTNRGFSANLIMEDYAHLDQEYMLSEVYGKPYPFCAGLCMAMVDKWAQKKRLARKHILVMVEDGDDDQGEFRERAHKEHIKVIPLSKQGAYAFQACDLAGWKSRTATEETLFGNITTEVAAKNVIRSLSLITPIVQRAGVANRDFLRKMCETKAVPKRAKLADCETSS